MLRLACIERSRKAQYDITKLIIEKQLTINFFTDN